MSWSGLPSRIENRIIPEPNSGCWIWLGGMRDKKDEYGGINWEGRIWRTHRLVFTLLNGQIPDSLDLDHTCRNRLCCNPEHLDPCTRAVNISRGNGVAPNNLRKTHCPQGHKYNQENTYAWNKQRFCRTCSNGYKISYARWHPKNRIREAIYDLWTPLTG